MCQLPTRRPWHNLAHLYLRHRLIVSFVSFLCGGRSVVVISTQSRDLDPQADTGPSPKVTEGVLYVLVFEALQLQTPHSQTWKRRAKRRLQEIKGVTRESGILGKNIHFVMFEMINKIFFFLR